MPSKVIQGVSFTSHERCVFFTEIYLTINKQHVLRVTKTKRKDLFQTLIVKRNVSFKSDQCDSDVKKNLT